MKNLLLFFVLTFAGARLTAQTSDADLGYAVAQLKSNGPVPFAKVMYPNDDESAKLLSDRLGLLTRDAGAALGLEIMSRRTITTKVERIVFAIYFERRPIYLRVDTYESSKGKIFLPAFMSKEAVDVLPLEVINPLGK